MKNKSLMVILSVFMIVVIGCSQTTSPQTSKTSFQPVAWLSGQPGAVNLTPAEGNGPFQCTITAGALPAGFALSNCVISGTAPVLAGGTTKSISPPFTITITNAAGQRQNLEYNILTVASLPAIIFNEPGTCIVKQKCNVNLIAQVNGGVPPYHFQSDTFRKGAPPLGMIVDVNGVLTGKPTKKGTYTFGVCVVDVVAASKCGQTSVFVKDKEEVEEIISYGESGGLCSSNTDCTGFAQNSCDAPENVRCGKDGLCHCCLTLCLGGANCKCIGCSTGCGGGTYCEGDVCVFEVGGYPNEEQITEQGVAVPQEEPKDVPETWSGTLTGIHARNPDRPDAQCYKGEFSANFRVRFSITTSLANHLRNQREYFPSEPNGVFGGEETVSVQPISTKPFWKCSMSGGTLPDTAVEVIVVGPRDTILISDPYISGKILLPERTDGFDGTSSWIYQPKLGQITLEPKSISDTAISGTWTLSSSFKGTFTLTKQ